MIKDQQRSSIIKIARAANAGRVKYAWLVPLVPRFAGSRANIRNAQTPYERFRPCPNRAYFGKFILFAGSVLGACTHLVFAAVVSYKLFAIAGGAKTCGRMTVYGYIDWAWTNIMWLPGGISFAVGDACPANRSLLALPGIVLFLSGSLIAGCLSATFIRASLRRPRNYGRYCWKVWAFALAWMGWIPVPVKVTFAYWHTVVY